QCQRLVAGHAAGAQRGIVDPSQRVGMQPPAADRRLHAPDDGRGRLAAELLEQDRARQRIDRIEAGTPARLRFDHADALHPCTQAPVAPLQVVPGGHRVETPRVSRHGAQSRSTLAAYSSQPRISTMPPKGAGADDVPHSDFTTSAPANTRVPTSSMASAASDSRDTTPRASAASATPWPNANNAAVCRLPRATSLAPCEA